MKRRDFLLNASAMALPLTLNGFGLSALKENSSLSQSIRRTMAVESDKILVIVYLNGGNDGLNTVIPLDHYSAYSNLRTNIAIPENRVLKLSGNLETGLHPVMTGMRDMYNEGKLAIIHSVSYPNPNQSHPRSTEIYMTGVESNQFSNSGWAGRYLDNLYPGYPTGYPNESVKDPVALQIGYINSPALFGNSGPMNLSLNDPATFYQVIGNVGSVNHSDLPCCDSGDLISYIREQQVLSIGYSAQLKKVAEIGKNIASYPTTTPEGTVSLAEQLKIVARLIDGGLQTKVYYVEMGGFDTHSTQVGSNTTEGTHANLLKHLSDSIAAFQNDLRLQGKEDKVVGMTFSDFGRRANSNASKGTDHGIAAPMFVFGKGIKRQIVGTNPDLTNGLVPANPKPSEKNRDIKMQIDFRRIYGDILNDWFGSSNTVADGVLFKNFKTTSLFSNVIETVSSGSWPDPNIWSAGRKPGFTDYVKINSGHTVALGQNVEVKNVQIESGGELTLLGNFTISTTG
jgi:uncharacterized protein (DUF1501 family)